MSKKTYLTLALIVGGLLIGLVWYQSKNNNASQMLETKPTPVNSITHGHGLAVDIADSNKVYIATHHGLLSLINDNELYQVGNAKDDYMGFSTHPTLENVFFSSGHPADGGNIGFQMSEDAGITWKKVSNGVNGPVDFHAMAISPVNPDLIYGWYKGSLQQSNDNGKNWKILNTHLSNVIALTADTQDENIIYAATTQGAYISNNKGTTWSGLSADIKNGAVTAIAINPSDSSKLLSFSEQLGLVKSEDKGVTWKQITSNFKDEVILFIAYDRKQPNVVYALTNKNSLYKSINDGNVWNKINI
jgi:photosystem II stability/assembly factor-like uncharacterized protein